MPWSLTPQRLPQAKAMVNNRALRADEKYRVFSRMTVTTAAYSGAQMEKSLAMYGPLYQSSLEKRTLIVLAPAGIGVQ